MLKSHCKKTFTYVGILSTAFGIGNNALASHRFVTEFQLNPQGYPVADAALLQSIDPTWTPRPNCIDRKCPPDFSVYETGEVDFLLAGLRSELRNVQSQVPTTLQQFNQDAQNHVAQVVAQTLLIQDIEHPTESQKQLIQVIRQIVREELQRTLQQQQ